MKKGQIHLTITYRFLERAIFILIILLLGFLLVNKYMEDTASCECPADQVADQQPTTTTPDDGTDTTDTQTGQDTTDTTDSQDTTSDDEQTAGDLLDDMKNDSTSDDSQDDSGASTSGELEVTLGQINWDIQNDSRAKITNIEVVVDNGLQDDIKLFATLNMFESGNDDLRAVNPMWDSAEAPLVRAGQKEVVEVEPSKHWPPNVEDGDDVSVSGNFSDLQETVSKSVSKDYTVG